MYLRLFYSQLTIKFENSCQSPYLICISLVLEATILQTAPQPRPYNRSFYSTALTSPGWVRMTIKPQHCPPSKQYGCHLISANFFPKDKISRAENQTQGCGVGSKYAIHCAMRPPPRSCTDFVVAMPLSGKVKPLS